MGQRLKSILPLTLAASLAIACGGGNGRSNLPSDLLGAAVADEPSRESAPRTPQSDDLLILTPSASNIPNDQIAVRVDGLAISRAEYEAGLRQFIEEHPDLADPDDTYRAQLREELLLLAYVRDELALREEDFRYRARAELRERIAALVLERIVDSRVSVTDDEIRQRYLADRDRWVQPARVIVDLILVATAAEAAAILQRVQAGESFDELARVFSLHSSSQRGGRMEPVRRGTYSPAFEEVAFRLRPGDMGTTENERGTLIVRKVADSSETVTPLAEVRDQIAEIIRLEKQAAERTRFLAEIEQRYPPEADQRRDE